MRELADIQIPDADADDDELLDYVLAIGIDEDGTLRGAARSPFISGHSQNAVKFLENREYLAFSVRNVDQTALTWALEVLKGRFDPEATQRALESCQECPPPELVQHRGIEFYSWGEDNLVNLDQRSAPPAYDLLGRGGRIAVTDSYVYRTVETPGMKALIDVHSGEGRSLADDADLALAAAEMDRLGLYAGMLLGDVELFNSEDFYAEDEERFAEEIAERALLGKYHALGAGAGQDESGPFITLIFVYGNESDAVNNEKVFMEIWERGTSAFFRSRWREILPNAPQVTVKGRALVTQLRTDRPGIWSNIVFARDSILWYR